MGPTLGGALEAQTFVGARVALTLAGIRVARSLGGSSGSAEGALDGTSWGQGELDGTSGSQGELDGTSGGKGELDGTSGGPGELDGTSGGKGELDGTNSWGRSGGADSRGRSGGADGGRSGGADSRGRSGGADSRGRSGGADSRGRWRGVGSGAGLQSIPSYVTNKPRGTWASGGGLAVAGGLTWAANGRWLPANGGLTWAANGRWLPANGGLGEPRAASKEPRERQTRISCGRRRRSSIFFGPSICHGHAAGRTRETRGKRNNGNLMTEHRIHNHIDELTDKDSGKTQGLWTHNNYGKQHQVRSKSNTDGDELTNDRKQEGPYKGVETQGKGRQSLTVLIFCSMQSMIRDWSFQASKRMLKHNKITYSYSFTPISALSLTRSWGLES